MSGKIEHIAIPKNVQSKDDLDFKFLREAGVAYIESLSGRLWTDYNTHDPGITILEMLCYAITDLGYRLAQPMEQLLVTDKKSPWSEQFHLAADILPSKAVTELDYRKLFIDCKGVRNAWILPFEKTVYVDCKQHRMSYENDVWTGLEPRFQKSFLLKGLYQVRVDLDGSVGFDRVSRQIFQKYHQHRNLCEDLIQVSEVEKHAIKVCAVVEIEPAADEEMIYARIEAAINAYFSPPIRFYDLATMLNRGFHPDEIFEGPLLEHGFLDAMEVSEATLRKEVRLSDIIKRIMNIPGILLIKDIQLGDCDDPADISRWVVPIKPGMKPVLCSKSKFNFYKGLLPLNVDEDKLAKNRQLLLDQEATVPRDLSTFRLSLPEAKYTPLDAFHSIRHDFPENYGIGEVGLTDSASMKRKAQARQLKSYLHFFDQIFASYFRHLHQVKDLLSVKGPLLQTYFTQAVDDFEDASDYLGSWYTSEDINGLLMGFLDEPLSRNSGLKDHLLARFAERFSEYAFVMKKLYGDTTEQQVLDAKSYFLSEYGRISAEIGNGFNYYRQNHEQLWGVANVSGVEMRISLLAGMKSYVRRHLSQSYVQLYSFKSAKGSTVYRWRILDQNRSILLSATENYPTTSQAYDEIYRVMQQVVQIDRELLLAQFEALKDVGYETKDVGCFRITKSPSGRYSFSIIDPSITDLRDSKRIIASQYRYYAVENIVSAILKFKSFIKSSFMDEGLFLVEHILLRPPFEVSESQPGVFLPFCAADCEPGSVLDPYSFRVTVVLPGNTLRFSDRMFRDYLENLIREELPSHILAKICWIGTADPEIPDQENPLVRFEDAFKNFLFGLGKSDSQHQPAFIDVLSKLRSIYPTGSLYDCAKEDENNWQDKIILGRTNLGTI